MLTLLTAFLSNISLHFQAEYFYDKKKVMELRISHSTYYYILHLKIVTVKVMPNDLYNVNGQIFKSQGSRE